MYRPYHDDRWLRSCFATFPSVFAFLMVLWSFAGFTADADTLPFSSGNIAVRVGGLFPLASLSEHFNPTVRAGCSLDMADWKSVRTRLDLAYTRLPGEDPMQYLFGAAGFDWRPEALPLEAGASLGLFYVRDKPDPGEPRLDDDGETEFGFALRAAAPVWTRGDWSVRLEAQWEEAFTRPVWSGFAWFGISLSRRAW